MLLLLLLLLFFLRGCHFNIFLLISLLHWRQIRWDQKDMGERWWLRRWDRLKCYVVAVFIFCSSNSSASFTSSSASFGIFAQVQSSLTYRWDETVCTGPSDLKLKYKRTNSSNNNNNTSPQRTLVPSRFVLARGAFLHHTASTWAQIIWFAVFPLIWWRRCVFK